MARNKRKSSILTPVNVDYSAIINSPQFESAIQTANAKDPMQLYKLITILEETANSITVDDKGKAFLANVKSRLNVNKDQLEKEFGFAGNVPAQIDEQIKKDPAKAYQLLYNDYTYEKGDANRKLTLRKLMGRASQELYSRGSSPQEVLQTNPFLKALNFFGNVMSVPTNLLAKGVAAMAGKGDAVKVWGGYGWQDGLTAMWSDSDMQSIITKRKSNIPLTPEEQTKLQGMEKKSFWPGLILNIVADPTIILGAAGKATKLIGSAVKSKELMKLGKVLSYVAEPVRSFRKQRKLVQAVQTGAKAEGMKQLIREGADILSQTPKNFYPTTDGINDLVNYLSPKKLEIYKKLSPVKQREFLIKELPSSYKDIGRGIYSQSKFKAKYEFKGGAVKAPLDITGTPINTPIEIKEFVEPKKITDKYLKRKYTSKDVTDRIAISLPVEKTFSPEVQKSLTAINKVLAEKKPSLEQVRSGIDNVVDVFNKAGKTKDASMIQKAFKGYAEQIATAESLVKNKSFQTANKAYEKIKTIITKTGDMTGIRKLLVSDVPMALKPAIDKIRRLGMGATNAVLKNADEVNKKIVKYMPQFEDMIKSNNLIKEYMESKGITEAKDMLMEIIERPKLKADLGIKNPELIDSIRSTLNDYIINEVRYSGAKITPMLADEAAREQWQNAAKEFNRYFTDNPYHPAVTKYENELRDILRNNSFKALDGNAADAFGDSVEYITHIMTPEAKAIFIKQGSLERGMFHKAFKSYVTNPSKIQRGIEGSVADINKAMTTFSDGSKLSDFAKDVLANTAPEDLKNMTKYAEAISEFGKKLVDKAGKRINFFDTDIQKILAIRGQRMAKTVQQGAFMTELKGMMAEGKYISKTKLPGYEEIKVGLRELDGNFAHPDIAQAIEKMWSYTKDERAFKRLLNFFGDVNALWKSSTLNWFPSTSMRNVFGNVFNSLLASDNPRRLLMSYRDALNIVFKKADYRIVTTGGHAAPLKQILKEMVDRGVLGSTFQNVDVRDIEHAGDVISGAMQVAGKKIRGFAENMPGLQKANSAAENISKMALFIDMLKQGETYDQAANTVFKILFDYSDLTMAEKGIRNFIPFFTWVRNNVPLQISQVFSKPTGAIFRGEKSWRKGSDKLSEQPEDRRFMSEYMQNAPTMKVGKQFVMLEGLIPAFDLAGVMRMAAKPSNAVDDFIRGVSPFIKFPIEMLTNRSFAFRRDIDKSKMGTSEFGGFDMPPKLKAALQNIRLLNTLNKGIAPGQWIGGGVNTANKRSLMKMLMSWLVATPIDYDKNLSKGISSKDYKNSLDVEINDANGWTRRLTKGMMEGQKPSKAQIETLRRRYSFIINMVQDGFIEGKLSEKERNQYGAKAISELMK